VSNESEVWSDECPSDVEFRAAWERKFAEFKHKPNEAEIERMIEASRDEWQRLASEREHMALVIADLYDTWQQKIDLLPVAPSADFRKSLFLDLVRHVLKNNPVPQDRIAQIFNELLP